MANTKKKTNNVKKEDKKETKKTTSKVVTNKNNSSKKKASKRKSYADEMKLDMSLQTKTTLMTIFTVILVLVTFYVITMQLVVRYLNLKIRLMLNSNIVKYY